MVRKPSPEDKLLQSSAEFVAGWRPPEENWGNWQLSEDTLELRCRPYGGGGSYPVDLEQFTSSAEVLDTIMQVAGKRWATDACLAGLVRALNDLLHPQAHLCSGGRDKRLTPAQLRRLLREGTP
jgi:hypothetical protein